MPMAIKTHTLRLNTGVVRDNAAVMELSDDDMFSLVGLMNNRLRCLRNSESCAVCRRDLFYKLILTDLSVPRKKVD